MDFDTEVVTSKSGDMCPPEGLIHPRILSKPLNLDVKNLTQRQLNDRLIDATESATFDIGIQLIDGGANVNSLNANG